MKYGAFCRLFLFLSLCARSFRRLGFIIVAAAAVVVLKTIL